MEQQLPLENHMRLGLAPPLTVRDPHITTAPTAKHAAAIAANCSATNKTTTSNSSDAIINRSPLPCSSPLHQQQQQQQQQMHAAQQAAPSLAEGSLSLSSPPPPPPPPAAINTPNIVPGAAIAPHQPISSSSPSVSSRLSSQAPAYSPPTYAFSQQANHDPASIRFPEPPSNELAPLQLNAHSDTNVGSLPSLASLTGAPATSSLRLTQPARNRDASYSPPAKPRPWPSGNPYSAYYASSGSQAHGVDSPARMDLDSMSSNCTRGALSPDYINGRASSVSLDDPDVRMAAEALGDLKADFVSSPQNKNPSSSPANHFGTPRPQEAEPLLSLVLSSGSLLARPIEGTVTAYTTTKNFSPGFIKTPVEYVEGVVGSGFHMTGIEGGVRWFFRGKGRHPPSRDLETGENSHKRRRVDNRSSSPSISQRGNSPRAVATLVGSRSPEIEPWGLAEKERRLSVGTIDTLPAYDDARSPAYSENATVAPNEKSMATDEHSSTTVSRSSSTNPAAWQQRLMMSTSGLSIAMSEESLRSLKYCLSWLRWANDHIGRVIMALKDALEKYDSQHSNSTAAMKMENGHAEGSEHARNELNARVSALRSDVLKTLTGVIETVSKYTGGALPENARVLVKRHLQSLPQRFMLATKESANANSNAQRGNSAATTEDGGEKDVREGAQRVLVMAKEGLDMMAQVSFVLDGTIISAEEWCERLGRKKRDQQDQPAAQDQEQHGPPQEAAKEKPQFVPFAGATVVADEDTKMSG